MSSHVRQGPIPNALDIVPMGARTFPCEAGERALRWNSVEEGYCERLCCLDGGTVSDGIF